MENIKMGKITFANRKIFSFIFAIYFCLLFIMGCPSYPENPKDQNQKPTAIAKAESDQPILLTDPNMVCCLDASESFDPDGDRLNYFWYSINEKTDLDLDDPVFPKVYLPKEPGDYYFILQVDDGKSFSELAMVKVTVKRPDAEVDSTFNGNPDGYHFKTIQGAIDAIYDGNHKIIGIINGPYKEKINVKSYMYLIGLKSERVGVPQICSVTDEGEAVVTLDDSVTIENLGISVMRRGCYDNGTLESSAIKVARGKVKIKNCKIQDSYGKGIILGKDSCAEITDTLLRDIISEGIVAEENSRLLVEKCRILYTGGSAIWGKHAYSVEISNSIIYYPGWHGLDLYHCTNNTIEHCTIINFGRWDDEPPTPRSGISIIGSDSFTVKSNLIEIRNNPVLIGISIYTDGNYVDLESDYVFGYNYIHSKQEKGNEHYYDGNITIQNVGLTNLPNRNTKITYDPLVIDPEEADFRLDTNSPALGCAENHTNPGADVEILKPYAPPTPPILSSPINCEDTDPNNLIFKWEASVASYGNSYSMMKYSITINEETDKEIIGDPNNDIPIYWGCENNQFFITGTSVNYSELKPLEKNIELGKQYYWCVQAIDEDGYKSKSIREIGWGCFITPEP